jgi:hypothetical protein
VDHGYRLLPREGAATSVHADGGVQWRDDRVLDTIQRSASGESGGRKVFAREIVEQPWMGKNALLWISRHTLTFACHRLVVLASRCSNASFNACAGWIQLMCAHGCTYRKFQTTNLLQPNTAVRNRKNTLRNAQTQI